ncbi:uncharacterized protein GGS22DRAFT_194957 [Annulohypoxylon maeteangense]|uniref:uncharacterized protein n=1 Tax=Annulohypoxylon maeteangense TaxID=1927788 RepID=UPI002007A2CF|nr:uncharacterized protein GGS22DRAFT_194957 [Annulohypoxylon maeteangense]KAI0883720.1 hypothetical protein GGS22DRAFT_194957 [Annulohypoxylon maeteangense]
MAANIPKVFSGKWDWNMISAITTIISSVHSMFKGSPELGKEMLDAVNNNHTDVKSIVDNLIRTAKSQAQSGQISKGQLKQILKALRGLESHVEGTNKALLDIAEGIKSFSKPSVMSHISNIGGILTGAAAIAEIKRLADSAERIDRSLNGIDQNLYSMNSRGDYFPQHVHSYIRLMIERHSQDVVPHYFFVFHHGHEWHPKFEDLQRQDPLGPQFIGYKDDLDELCAFLVNEVRPRVGEEPVLHILIPTVKPLVITESLTFPDAMRPFCVEGQRGDGEFRTCSCVRLYRKTDGI